MYQIVIVQKLVISKIILLIKIILGEKYQMLVLRNYKII